MHPAGRFPIGLLALTCNLRKGRLKIGQQDAILPHTSGDCRIDDSAAAELASFTKQ